MDIRTPSLSFIIHGWYVSHLPAIEGNPWYRAGVSKVRLAVHFFAVYFIVLGYFIDVQFFCSQKLRSRFLLTANLWQKSNISSMQSGWLRIFAIVASSWVPQHTLGSCRCALRHDKMVSGSHSKTGPGNLFSKRATWENGRLAKGQASRLTSTLSVLLLL